MAGWMMSFTPPTLEEPTPSRSFHPKSYSITARESPQTTGHLVQCQRNSLVFDINVQKGATSRDSITNQLHFYL